MCAILTLYLTAAALDVPVSPQQVWLAAHADLMRQSAGLRPYLRYLSLHDVPLAQREDRYLALSLHCNSLSTESDITVPAIVPGSGGALVRVNISDYGWKPDVWDRMVDEPYFHEAVIIGGKRKFATARWLNATASLTVASTELSQYTQSRTPMVLASWFVNQTAIQADRDPGYYDFLGIEKKADFERLMGFDKKLLKASKRKELLAAVAISGVTQQPRRVARFPTLGGGYWVTFDQQVKAVNERNPLRVLDDDNFKFDASEEFGPGPNGLFLWSLFAANGDRQDSVPDKIAGDHFAPGNDHRIHVGLSCVRCHGKEGGINAIDDWARDLLRPPFGLQSPDYETLKDLRQKYLRGLEAPIDDDKRSYSRAVKLATGLTVEKACEKYAAAFESYEYAKVNLEGFSRLLGCPPERVVQALKATQASTGQVDPVLAVFLRRNGRPVGIRQIEEVYGLMQGYLLSTYGASPN